MTPLHPLFDDLLSVDSWTRRAAVGRSDVSQPALRFALRRILWRDRDAGVRAAAAIRLSRVKVGAASSPTATVSAPSEVASWLSDALGDVAPMVREAALRGLARLAPRLPVLARAEYGKAVGLISSSDATWWVRRAALLAHAALLSLQAERSLPLLRMRLGDPFWRVRHAAAQALYAIGLRQPELREAILAANTDLPGAAQAGLWYLRARFQPGIEVHAFAVPPADGPLHNPDPAVVTARLRARPLGQLDATEASEPAIAPADLVAFFPDPHEALRRLAVEHLHHYLTHSPSTAEAEGQRMAVLRSLLPWLETPTLPHAAETTAAFLDRLGEPAARLARDLLRLDSPPAGALSWAAAYAAQTAAHELLPLLCRQLEHRSATARTAVMAAILALPPAPDAPLPSAQGNDRSDDHRTDSSDDPRKLAFLRGLADERIEVRSLAAVGLAGYPMDPRLHAVLWDRPLADYRPAARLALVDLARRSQDRAGLGRALYDAHPLVRAAALRALLRLPAGASAGAGAGPDVARPPDPWLADRDPELRCAALPAAPEQAPRLLAEDPDPYVRRAALRTIASPAGRQHLGPARVRQAALLASGASDPWLRTEAAALLSAMAEDSAGLVALLRLSRDPVESVRAAAADGLQDPAITPRLRSLIAWGPRSDQAPEIPAALAADERAAAYAWIALHEGAAASDLLQQARLDPSEPEAVRQILPSLLFLSTGESPDVDEPGASAATVRPTVSPPAMPVPARRVLGRTGIAVSPLGLSGAYDPPLSAMHRARAAGVNLFFWEPSYLRLTRFLRRHNMQGPAARRDIVIVAGSFEADRVGIERDVARALRRLRTSYLDVLLLLWVRSPERLSPEALDTLQDLKRRGVIRAFGFSTHHRDLAEAVVPSGRFDVVMLRHSAAHPGAEDRLLPLCAQHGVGVITFSALSYGRLLRAQPAAAQATESQAAGDEGDALNAPSVLGPLPTASECYRYTLSQPGVSACWSAPRSYGELAENLGVLSAPPLPPADCERLRRHGKLVRAEDRRFSAFLRKGTEGSPETLSQLQPPPDPLVGPDAGSGSADALLAEVLGLLDAQPLAADYGDPDAPAGGSTPGGAGSASSPGPDAGGGGPFALGFGHSFLSRRRKSEKM
ncbi:MAG TPA: aldo/keto reductase [Pseudomonadota bacterium]|nr:aldo/keto reductase [Pseudomonadota bacterium]